MNKPIYLDNAATSFPKPRVVTTEVSTCIRRYCANPGRSMHEMAIISAEKAYETRELLASFLGMRAPERIVFAHNATHALNYAIKGLINHKCHVISSDIEHNSVIRPLESVKRERGVDVSLYNSDLPLEESITPLIRADTEFLVTTLASNVTGRAIDVCELARIASTHRLTVIADASQYVGHLRLDLASTPLDIVCAPSHKALLGIQGGGFIAINRETRFGTIVEGGSGGDSLNLEMPEHLPERLEPGTQNLPSIVALGAGIKYLRKMSMEYVEQKMASLTSRLGDVLSAVGAQVYGCENGIASFTLGDMGAEQLSRELDRKGIAVRGGLHCAPSIHKKLGTVKGGLVRVSMSVLNKRGDLDRLYRALKEISVDPGS